MSAVQSHRRALGLQSMVCHVVPGLCAAASHAATKERTCTPPPRVNLQDSRRWAQIVARQSPSTITPTRRNSSFVSVATFSKYPDTTTNTKRLDTAVTGSDSDTCERGPPIPTTGRRLILLAPCSNTRRDAKASTDTNTAEAHLNGHSHEHCIAGMETGHRTRDSRNCAQTDIL